MHWQTFRSLCGGAGDAALAYYPKAAPSDPIYMIAVTIHHFDSEAATRKVVNGATSIYLDKTGSGTMELNTGYMSKGSMRWTGRLPLSTGDQVKGYFKGCAIGDLVEMTVLLASKAEVF